MVNAWPWFLTLKCKKITIGRPITEGETMTTRKLLSVRIDKPSAKDRIIERLEAIA